MSFLSSLVFTLENSTHLPPPVQRLWSSRGVALALGMALAGCGSDGDSPDEPELDGSVSEATEHDAGTVDDAGKTDPDAGKTDPNAGKTDAGAGKTDAGAGQQTESDAGERDAAGEGSEDASEPDDSGSSQDAEPAAPDLSGVFVEQKGSLALEEPARLSELFGLLVEDTGNVRVFVTDLKRTSDGYDVTYGAAELDNDGLATWQKPDSLATFSATALSGKKNTYASSPFELDLSADVKVFGFPFQVRLTASRATWQAKFSEDGESIERGTVSGFFPHERALEASFLGIDLCADTCPEGCKGGSVKARNMAEVLECNGQEPDEDLDGDGTNDAYTLRIGFKSERVELKP